LPLKRKILVLYDLTSMGDGFYRVASSRTEWNGEAMVMNVVASLLLKCFLFVD